MRKRMRTMYLVNGTRGDCPKWAREAREMGQDVTVERVPWLGKAWPCPACMGGHH